MKYQIITLAAKVYALYFPEAPTDVDNLDAHLKQVHLLYTYTMSLARYDTSYDIRDRTRLLKNVHLNPLREAALHTPKPVPRMETVGQRGSEWTLGSMAQVIARDTQGQLKLPDWGSEIPEKGVRDLPEPSQTGPVTVVPAAPVAAVSTAKDEKKKEKKVWKDLDKFYASESEEEEEEGEEEDETEEEEEEAEEEEGSGEEESEEEEEEESEEENSESDRLVGHHQTSGGWT